MIWPLLFLSIFLFYGGILFAYFVIFPMLFHALVKFAPSSVLVSPDISDYLDLTSKLLLIFGVLFEIPIVMLVLVASGVITPQKLIRLRSYAIVSAFVLGMMLGPPDVFSQVILALPIWLLYETGILLAYFFKRS